MERVDCNDIAESFRCRHVEKRCADMLGVHRYQRILFAVGFEWVAGLIAQSMLLFGTIKSIMPVHQDPTSG